MSRSKKIIGLALAVVMLFGCFTTAFAFADPTDKTADVKIETSAAQIAAGATVDVTVSLKTNFTVATFSIPVFYEKDLVSVSDIAVPAGTTYQTATEASANAAQIYANAGVTDTAKYGFVMVTFIPSQGTPVSVINDTVLTFKATAAAAASGTVTFATLETARKTSSNQTGPLYVGSIASDTISMVPTNVETAGLVAATPVQIGATAEPADLALTEAGAAAGVIIDSNKTFGGQYAGAVYGFPKSSGASTFKNTKYFALNLEVTNGGSMVCYTSDGKTTASGNYGTGSRIKVLNADGTESKTYVVVIFGDVDGNGLVNPMDIGELTKCVSTAALAPNNSVKRMAANCQVSAQAQAMHILNAMDTGNCTKLVVNYDVKSLAQSHYKNTRFYL